MRNTTRSRLRPLSLALCLALAYPLAQGLPQGAQVVQGQVKVSTPQPGQGLIVQGSDKAIVNWQSFSIAAGEGLRIQQPGVNSVLLNRVVGGDPSLILGQMQANGQVFLINPRGIVFGRGSQVDVGGLVASTLDLSDSAFLAGNYSFTAGPGAGGLQADGSISAPGGTVALLAPQLSVGGSIQARRVGLAAAGSVQVDVEGDGLVLFNLRNDESADVALKFSGRIQAEGGSAELRAQARAGAAGQVLNMDGVVQARGLSQQGGRIVIDGGTAGDTLVNGSLIATGETGGSVTVLGQRVALLDAARLDASGLHGGGSLQVGGGFQGQGTGHNAERTWIASGAQLRADASEQGDGGSIAVWADLRTDMFGRISARGGRLGGNGGQVETSGHEQLNMTSGSVDVSAPLGHAGSWLLDPNNLTIDAVASSHVPATTSPFLTTNDGAKLDVSVLNAALTGSATVIVRTTSSGSDNEAGDITIKANIQPAGASTLNLVAQGSINFSGGKIVVGTGALNVNLLAGSDSSGNNPGGRASAISATGAGTIIDTNGGTLSATAKNGIAFGGVNSGALTITSSGGTVVLPTGTVSGALQANSGGGAITQAVNGLVVTGTTSLTATGATITLADTHNDLQNTVNLTGGATQIVNTKNAGNVLKLGTLATGNLDVTAGGGTLTLGTGTVTGTLTANSGGGAITQAAGGLVVTSTSSLTATGATITLVDTHNDLQDSISLTGGATQIVNTKNASNALKLGTLATGNLDVTAGGGTLTLGTGTVTGTLTADSGGGAITQAAGGLVVTSTSSLTATGATITLADTHNDLQNTVNLTGGATQIVNTKNVGNALKLGTLATGNLDVTAGGGTLTLGTGTVTGTLTADSGGGAITQAAGGLVVTSTSSLTATGATITLADAHNDLQDSVSLAGGATQIVNTKNASNALKLGTLATGNLDVTASGGTLTLGTGTVTGTLTADSGGGAITQAAGGLVVTSTSSLTATGATITLADTHNDLQNTVNLTGGATQIVNTKNVGNALKLGTLATGNLDVTAGGGTLTLGTGTVTGTLTADSGGGAITQAAGGLVVTGSSSLTATGATITLTDASNDLQGVVSLTGGATQLKNTKNVGNALTLGTLDTGNLTVTAGGGALDLGTGTVNGNLSATSGGGAITQTANGLVVTGTSGFNAGSAAITLLDAANNLQGAVSLTGGVTQISNGSGHALALGSLNTLALTATTTGAGLQLGTGTVTGNLVANSGGALTQAAGGLVVTGTSDLNAGSAAITLTDTHNDLQGTVDVTGGATQLKNSKNAGNALTLGSVSTTDLTVTAGGGALDLGTGTVNGNLSATSGGGAITQTANGLVVTGTSGVNAGSAAITLLDAANNLQGAVSLTGGVTQISNGSGHALALGNLNTLALTATTTGAGLQLGTGTVTGNLVANSGGALTQAAGGLVVTGTSDLNAGSAAITLTDTHNDLQGTVDVTGGATQLKNSKNAGNALTLGSVSTAALTVTAGGGALDLGTGTVGGNLSATSGGGAITQATGGLVVTGTSSLNAGSATITLTDNANDLQGAVSLTGGVTQIKNTKNAGNALTLGTLNTGNLTATAGGGALDLGTGTVGGNLSATSGGGAITQAAGGLVVTGTSSLNAGSAAITLTDNANDLQGGVSLTGGVTQIKNTKNVGNALTLAALNTGNLTATAGGGTLRLGTGTVTGTLTANSGGGAITQAAGGLVVTGASGLTATGAAITLTDANNDLQGAVSLTGGVTQIKNTKNTGNALTLATLNTGNLSVTAGGGALNLGTGTVAGTLNATSGGGAITQAAGGLAVTGNATINAGAAAITLNQLNNDWAGSVGLTGGTTAITSTRTASSTLTLGALNTGNLSASTAGGDLTLGTGTVNGTLVASTAGGDLGQAAGGITVNGVATLNATTAGNVNLTDTHNHWNGGVQLTGNSLDLRSAGDLNILALTQPVNRALTLAADGNLTLGAVDLDTGTADLSLTSLGGSFTAGGKLAGRNIALAAQSGLNLGHDITATGTLGLTTTTGGITQTAGAIHVTGATTVAAGSASIALAQAGNHFGGAVQLTGASSQITDSGALTLGTLATGSLTATSTGALNLGQGTVTGALVATSNGGSIGQAGTLTVTGPSTLNAGSGAITLAQAANDLQGSVGVTGGAVTLRTAHNLTLSALTQSANQALDLEATGLLTLPVATTNLDTGTAALTLISGGGAINAPGTLKGSDITLRGTSVTLAHDITASGNLDVRSTSTTINQTGGRLSVAGTSQFNAGAQALTLGGVLNDFQGAVSLTGGATQIAATSLHALNLASLVTGNLTVASGNALRLGTGTVTGNLGATSAGAMTQAAGGVAVTGTTSLNAGSAAITLLDAANSWGGAVGLTGGASQLRSNGALVLGAGNVASLALTAGGAVSQSAALSVTGTLNVNAGSAAIDLSNANNQLTGAATLTGGTTQVRSNTALTLGNLATGDLTVRSSGALNLGQGTVGGALVANSGGGAVTQGGALDVAGAANVQAGTGSITLAQAANQWHAAVQLGGGATQIAGSGALTLSTLNTGNLAVTSTGALDLGQGTVAGSLNANSGGNAITQAGALQVSGVATLDAGAADITLTRATNQLQGALNLTANAVTVVNQPSLDFATLGFNSLDATSNGGINLGSGALGGTLTARALGGAITQSAGGLTVAGVATLQASNGITLTDAANRLQGLVNLSGAGAGALTNATDLRLGTLATGSLTLNAAGTLDLGTGSVGGNLNATSSGALTQTGALAVSGNATLNAGSGTITLDQSGNAFAGTVNLGGGNTLITNTGALNLGSLGVANLTASSTGALQLGTGTVSGSLSASSGGVITQAAGGLSVSGAAGLDAGGNAVQLADAGNAFAGAVSLHAGDVNLVNGMALRLGASTVNGNLSATTAGTAISQTGALTVTGASSFVADGNAVGLVLDQAGNQLQGAVSTSSLHGGSFVSASIANAPDLSFSGDAQTLSLGTGGLLTLGGGRSTTLTATAVTGVTQTGALDVSGLTALVAGGAAMPVDLSHAGNDLTRVQLTAQPGASLARVQLRDGDASRHDGLQVSGDAATLEITSAGALDLGGGNTLNLLADTSASGAAITQSGRLAVSGLATLKAGSGTVTLARADNSLPNLSVASAGSASLASAGDVALNASSVSTQLQLASPGAISIVGPLTGNGELVISGNGSLVINSAQSYSGGTRIQSGSLVLQGGTAQAGSGAVQLGAAGQLDLRDGATLGNALVSQGGSVLNSSGTGTLSGAVTLQALTTFLPAASAGGLTVSGAISDAGAGVGLRLGSAGTLTLAGSNHYSGTTDIAAGTLRANGAGALSSTSAVQLGAGAVLALGADQTAGSLSGAGRVGLGGFVLGVGADGHDSTFGGSLVGSGGLTKLGVGRLTLSGQNTLTGDVLVNAGSLQLAAVGVVPTGTAVGVAGGATLELLFDQGLSALSGSGQVLLNANTLTLGASGHDSRFDGVIGGSGGLTKAGTGTVTLGGANLYTGGTRVSGGTLALAATQALAGTGSLVIDTPARVQVAARQAVASLGGAGSLELNGATLAVGAGGADGRFDGAVSGTGGLTKQGAGTLTLTAAASNSGATVIEAGTVKLTGSGSLGTGEIQNQGSLSLDRGDALTLAQAITGSGGLVVNQGQVTLDSAGNSYAGTTQVVGGSLITSAAERLPDASAVTVAAGAQLQLGGSETIASLQAAGSVRLAGNLTTRADQVYTGSLTLANPSGITLSGTVIDASRSTNQFAGTPLGLSGGQALVTVKESLQLGNVTLSNGGRIEAERLDINGALQLTGGNLSLVATAAPDDAKATAQGIAQVPLAGVNLALAETTVQQGTGSAITVAEGAQLAVQAAGGGSVQLGQDANSFKGQLSVLSGASYNTAWAPNVKGSLGVQSLVRVAGQQMQVGGSGIEADIVSIRADQLATTGSAKLVARLPFDETLLGKLLSVPSMTLELTPAAIGQSGSFGVPGGTSIQVEVGSTTTGSRTSGPNAGYLTVLPKAGAQGGAVIVLSGPEVGGAAGGGAYRFFHDGARLAAEIPVVYNGVLPLTPSASGALSSINGDAEDARRARFQETVRTENVTVRLRSGVIAEVGPGRASTQGSEGATPPVQCDPASLPLLSCK